MERRQDIERFSVDALQEILCGSCIDSIMDGIRIRVDAIIIDLGCVSTLSMAAQPFRGTERHVHFHSAGFLTRLSDFEDLIFPKK